MSRVTDLEKFALEQVYRPYWNTLIIDLGVVPEGRPDRLTKNVNLENAVSLLKAHPKWANLVIDRISRCKFTFAKYLESHELVKFIQLDFYLS